MHRSTSRTSLVLAFCVVAAGATFAAVGSSATGPNAQLATQNRIYGGGQFTTSPEAGSLRNFAIDAHTNGATAYGDIEYGSPFHAGHEQVTCLKVVGNQATVGAVVTQADRPETIRFLALQVFQDNGGVLSGTPDAATFQVTGTSQGGLAGGWANAGFPYVCPSPDVALSFFGLSFMPLNAGDLVVHDATSG